MPITINTRDTVGETFRALKAYDPNLVNGFEPLSSFRFNSTTPTTNLLQPGPVNIDGEEWDFEWDNGMRSLARRGLYKIVGNVQQRNILDLSTNRQVPTWSADVLYTPRIDYQEYFQFFANIGPLINVHGIGFNLSSIPNERIITSKLPNGATRNKEQFFISMQNRIFYVSQQVRIDNYYKQTAWFLL